VIYSAGWNIRYWYAEPSPESRQ